MKQAFFYVCAALIGMGLNFGIGSAHAGQAEDIMQRVVDRDDGASNYSKQIVATCRYTISAGRLACADTPRVKVLESVQKDFGDNGKDSRSISFIQKPVAEQGIGFLQYDYDDPLKDTDQWMYLSALNKVKRIVSGKQNQPKEGTLFGSEIAYEDVERPHLDDYSYRLLKEETFQGRPCWVIEAVPKPERARKSNYSKSVQWIDKERDMALKIVSYDRRQREVKQVTFAAIKLINNIWVAHRINFNNVQTRRITTMKTDGIKMNIDVEDELFGQRALTDAGYRAGRLQQLRGQL
ncbi:MAG: outer membrane lipoprotein-sorting protein [Gammaproteobacteria bacterium]|nr:outer membrane lipoprotein-sorting protein [Gammaproteobacteria bacterium]MDH5801869.1 outer membrane lipoprotein-sorting protein [Gammaproteobacteria bacterium]